MSNRLDKDRQLELEPERLLYAKKEIEKLGYEVSIQPNGKSIKFIFKQKVVILFPYSGWHTGASIIDGRGLQNLLNQIKQP